GVAADDQVAGQLADLDRAAARRGERLDALRRAAGERAEVELVERDRVVRVLEAAEREQVADEPGEGGRLVLRTVEVVLVADALLERLERAAQREQRGAQIVCDRGDHEAALALGRRGRPQRLPQAAGHTAQRVADLGDLARAGRRGLDVE